MSLPPPRVSTAWRRFFPLMYRLLALVEPFVRMGWRAGYGNFVELRVAGHRTGRQRRVLLGLLRDGSRWYLGHPSGHVPWTRNLAAAGTADLVIRPAHSVAVRAVELLDGGERDRAILATSQHPFPGNLVYRLARRHIRAEGVYFRIDTLDPEGD